MKELRRDWINDDKVILAQDRSKRPMDKIIYDEEEESYNEYEKECPFCRGNEEYTPSETFKIEGNQGWNVRSTDNKYPIVDDVSTEIYGAHEVMIDTYRHNGSFYNMSIDEFTNLFTMYKNRYCEFINKPKVEYVSIFKNFLRKAGASLQHPHSQIISIPLLPPDVEKEISVAKNYYNTNKSCMYTDVINSEIKYNKRVVNNSDKFLVIIPYASRYSGEVRVIFKEKIKFEEIDNSSIEELSQLFNKLFNNLYTVNGYCPFNLYIHTHPISEKTIEYYNVHIHIVPRRYSYGGFELGTGIYVSSLNPEEFAEKLKFS
ncbi:MAG: galactose-1-phosphate uridylyltransferase [Peptostreptococcaceae bacterium]